VGARTLACVDADSISFAAVTRRARRASRALRPLVRRAGPALVLALALPASVADAACTTVDPGANFVVPDEHFDSDFFFCHVEPQVLFAKKCGSGDPSAGDASGGCHFNSSAVSGMALVDHAAIDCGGGDHPLDRSQVSNTSAAGANLQAASLEMSTDYMTAPIYVRPSGANHPRVVLMPGDAAVDILGQWAQKK
jgi:hypothetical protein